MADKKKGSKSAPSKDAKKGAQASQLRDLDMLDSKIANVKGGQKRQTRKRN